MLARQQRARVPGKEDQQIEVARVPEHTDAFEQTISVLLQLHADPSAATRSPSASAILSPFDIECHQADHRTLEGNGIDRFVRFARLLSVKVAA